VRAIWSQREIASNVHFPLGRWIATGIQDCPLARAIAIVYVHPIEVAAVDVSIACSTAIVAVQSKLSESGKSAATTTRIGASAYVRVVGIYSEVAAVDEAVVVIRCADLQRLLFSRWFKQGIA
jgi:molybdenum cofactor biosynthesis enzyme